MESLITYAVDILVGFVISSYQPCVITLAAVDNLPHLTKSKSTLGHACVEYSSIDSFTRQAERQAFPFH